MSQRQFWFLFVVVLILLALAFLNAHVAKAGMMGGVGNLMSPTNGNNPPTPGIPTNAIVTDTGLGLVTDTGQYIVTN